MARLVVLAFVLVVGCSRPSGPTAVASAQLSPSDGALASPATSAPPVVDLQLSAADLSCRLPVTFRRSSGDAVSYQGGFITFPKGTFSADAAAFISSGYVSADYFNTAIPDLRGIPQTGPPFYDLAVKRWVPAGAGQSSPDGTSYAYGSIAGISTGAALRIHVVDVARATEKTYTIPATPDFGDAIGASVDDYDGSSVYFSSMQSSGPALGVWSLDVATGAVTKLSSTQGVAAVRGGYAWVNRIDPRDPQGPQFPGIGGRHSNSVVRIDLATGQEVLWYYAKGNEVFFAGFDKNGDPLISNSWPPFAYGFLVIAFTAGGNVATVYDGSRTLSFSGVQGDEGGRLWLGNDKGIYLFTPATGLRKVFAFGAQSIGAEETVLPAGFCT